MGSKRIWLRLAPEQVLALGFLFTILIGALLLSLPISTVNGERLTIVDAVFMATSSVCVTGLTVIDVGNHLSFFGQIVTLILIQIGALGFMTMTTLAALLLGRRIGLRERILLQESLHKLSIAGVVRLTLWVLISTAIIEGIGVIILFLRFLPQMPTGTALYFSIFHAVSAFANAGFDLHGNFASFTGYYSDLVVNLTLPLLFVLGGLGFHVLYELFSYPYTKSLSLHSKIVLTMTLILVVIGTCGFLILEWSNPESLQTMSLSDKLLTGWFQGLTARTAGFSTVDYGVLQPATLLLTAVLMFIGASPGGTGGGIKTTTIACLLLAAKSEITGREDIEIFERRINSSTVFRALAIIMIALLVCFLGAIILSFTEGFDFIEVLFETISAFGTVGLSTGITTGLTTAGRIAIIFLMYIGRIGPITIGFALAKRKNKMERRFAEESIMVG